MPLIDGKHPPGAILLISDGASNVGGDPIAAAREAASLHIPIYTVALGTLPGHDPDHEAAARRSTCPCRRARRSSRRSQASPAGRRLPPLTRPACGAVYAHLAAKLGHKTVKQRDHRELCRRGPGAAAGRQRPVAPLVRPPHLKREQSRRTDERVRPDQRPARARRATPSRRRCTRSSG